MSDTKTAYAGSCLCGGIAYQVDALEPKMGHCHCTMCRKFHGAGFATFGEAKAENFRWVQGAELLQQFKAENGTVRQFCSRCGSSMTFAASTDATALVEFSLATLDTPIAERPDVHIFTAYSADWLEWQDQLPKFPEGRGS